MSLLEAASPCRVRPSTHSIAIWLSSQWPPCPGRKCIACALKQETYSLCPKTALPLCAHTGASNARQLARHPSPAGLQLDMPIVAREMPRRQQHRPVGQRLLPAPQCPACRKRAAESLPIWRCGSRLARGRCRAPPMAPRVRLAPLSGRASSPTLPPPANRTTCRESLPRDNSSARPKTDVGSGYSAATRPPGWRRRPVALARCRSGRKPMPPPSREAAIVSVRSGGAGVRGPRQTDPALFDVAVPHARADPARLHGWSARDREIRRWHNEKRQLHRFSSNSKRCEANSGQTFGRHPLGRSGPFYRRRSSTS